VTQPGSDAGPVLRRMEDEDLPAVMELDALCLKKPWSGAVWRSELESPFGLYLILEEESGGGRAEEEPSDRRSIFGQIGVRHVSGELHVTTIAVRPERRRRGYARILLGTALAAFPRAHVVHLEVRPSNEAARALYESLGFVTTGRRRNYYGDEDALLMTLYLRDRRPWWSP
jgi:[ribosomal protein S18]-alanine N-acetyltransferase